MMCACAPKRGAHAHIVLVQGMVEMPTKGAVECAEGEGRVMQEVANGQGSSGSSSTRRAGNRGGSTGGQPTDRGTTSIAISSFDSADATAGGGGKVESTPAENRLRLLAAWAGLQALWLVSLAILPATLRRDIPEAWLYPAADDLMIAVTGPFIAVALLRRRRSATWMTTIVWFAVSAFIRVNEVALILKVGAPAGFFWGNSVLAGLVVSVVLVLHLVSLGLLAEPPVRDLLVGEVRPGTRGGRVPRVVAIALAVWAVVQVGRFIAISVIGDVLNGTADPAWLAPAVGDLIVATPSLWLAWALWRRRSAWVWVVSIVYLVVSVVDHADTVTGDVRVASPPTFENMGEMPFPTWFAPLSQGLLDMVFIALMLWPVVRRSYFVLESDHG